MHMEAVKVIARFRPFNNRELERRCTKCMKIDATQGQVHLMFPTASAAVASTTSSSSLSDVKIFTFDAVYDETATQQQVYDETVYPLVSSVLEGFNGCCFAYGQTGCGKSFTMNGSMDAHELRGIIPQAFDHIFDAIDDSKHDKSFLVRVSYIEIYNENVRDLLGDDPKQTLALKENKERGVFVQGLMSTIVNSVSSVEKLMRKGNSNRTVGATMMNADSSRSHSIFMLHVESSESLSLKDGGCGGDGDGNERIRVGQLNLIDLAGSERQGKTGATGIRLKEATKINLSLSALGNVISALVTGGATKHIPYRDSKLTRLLQDSLGGNSKTTMIACCSPADDNYEETLSTLRYASRAKLIKNKPIVNEDPKDALLREYQKEIQHLKEMLQQNHQSDDVSRNLESNRRLTMVEGIIRVNEGDVSTLSNTDDNVNALKEERQKLVEMQSKLAEEWKRLEDLRKQLHETQVTNGGSQKAEEDWIDSQSNRLEHVMENAHARTEELNDVIKEKVEKKDNDENALLQVEKFQQTLEMLEAQMVQGGKATESLEKKHKAELRKAKLKLIQRKEREHELLENQRKTDQQRLLLEEHYNSLHEEVGASRKKIAKLQQEYKRAQTEINDLQREFQEERTGLLDDANTSYREIMLLRQILEHYISTRDLDWLIERSSWDERRDCWMIPTSFMPTNTPLRLTIPQRIVSMQTASNERMNTLTLGSNENSAPIPSTRSLVMQKLAKIENSPMDHQNVQGLDTEINDLEDATTLLRKLTIHDSPSKLKVPSKSQRTLSPVIVNGSNSCMNNGMIHHALQTNITMKPVFNPSATMNPLKVNGNDAILSALTRAPAPRPRFNAIGSLLS